MQCSIPPHRAGFLAVTRCHRRFSGFFWLIQTGRPFRNFCTTASSDGSASCGGDSRFTGFWGSGGLSQHAKCGPTEPCLESHVSLGPEIWPFFWGGWGLFRRLGTGFVGYGLNRQKTVLAVTRRHWRVFGIFFGSSGLRLRCATFLC